MATLPSHVAVGDPGTATFINNLEDWVGTPIQMTSWGPGFISTPPAGTQLQQQRGYASVTTNSTGAATISLTTAFPNGLAWFRAVSTTGTVCLLRSTPTGTNTSTLVFVAYGFTGATVNSTAITFQWEAEGW